MITARKIATYLMISTLAFAGKTAVAKAAETSEVPLAGITLLLEEVYQTSHDADEEITQYLLSEITSEYKNLAFAQVTNYVNIRNKASEKGEILGKLYDNSAATILQNEGDWYKIESGSVTGYIKSDYLRTGESAVKIAKSTGTRWATVNTTTLKVREKSSLDAEVLTLVPMGEELEVIKETDDWLKVSIDGNTSGYVSADYVKLRTEYEEAISIEEEQERLAEEAAAREAEEREQPEQTERIRSFSSSGATRTVSSGISTSSISSSSTNQSVSSNDSAADTSSAQSSTEDTGSSNQASIRSRIVTYALKFEGNPYVWGGTSLTNGADCSGFTQAIFADFGISIPRTSRTQATGGRRVSISEIQPGDLIFYARNGTINHVAIYIGNGKVINASSPSTGIRICSYNYRPPYKAVSYIY